MSNKIQPQIHAPQLNKTYSKFKNVPKEYLAVAEGMESQFIEHMVGEMRKSVKPTTPESSATQFYNSLLDSERSKIMSQTENGVGLKEVILDQIYPQYKKLQKPSNEVVKNYQVNSSNKGVGHE